MFNYDCFYRCTVEFFNMIGQKNPRFTSVFKLYF